MRLDGLTATDVVLIATALAILAGRLDGPHRDRCQQLARDIASAYQAARGEEP